MTIPFKKSMKSLIIV